MILPKLGCERRRIVKGHQAANQGVPKIGRQLASESGRAGQRSGGCEKGRARGRWKAVESSLELWRERAR